MSNPKINTKLLERFQTLEGCRVHFGLKKFLWTFFGRIGNKFFSTEPPKTITINGSILLNLGCGDRRLEGWVNADFYRLYHFLWQRERLPDWMVDISKPLHCKDNFWDGILIEHVNEHILYSQNLKLFSEIFRVLKPDGVLRIVVPDLDRYLNWADLRSTEPKMARYGSLAEAVSNLTQNHAHASVWNEALLNEVLSAIGFIGIQKKEYRVSSNHLMAVDAEGHRWESLYMEARKPINL